MALRIRPVSDAEQDEAATIVAHRLDEQVRPAFGTHGDLREPVTQQTTPPETRVAFFT